MSARDCSSARLVAGNGHRDQDANHRQNHHHLDKREAGSDRRSRQAKLDEATLNRHLTNIRSGDRSGFDTSPSRERGGSRTVPRLSLSGCCDEHPR